jgi:hypothetical protein
MAAPCEVCEVLVVNGSRIKFTVIGGVIALALVLLSAYWVAVSRKTVRIQFSQNSYCEWRRNEWFTARATLSYYKDNRHSGSVQMRKGIFESPAAMFAGLRPNTVICLYILDTTIAVFAVEFDQSDPAGKLPPDLLRNTIIVSNFVVRPCTQAEVTHLKSEISSTQRPCTQTFGLFNCSANPSDLKRNLLHVVDLGTVPQSQRTGGSAFEAHPQIPPEG